LLYNAKRSATAKCVGDCGFWAIQRSDLLDTIKIMAEKDYSENRKFLEKVSFFSQMTKS
jgi:cGMP-dependent protein kinase